MTPTNVLTTTDFDKLSERAKRWLLETRGAHPSGTFSLDFRAGTAKRVAAEVRDIFFDRVHGGHGPQAFWGGVSRKAQYRWSTTGEALWAARAPVQAVSGPSPVAPPAQEDEPGMRTWTLAGLTYTSRDGGRWTCRGDDAQSLAPNARRARFGDGPEVDAENCHPSLILQILGAERFPVLADYVADRGAWLARLQDEYSVDRAGAKRVVIALLYGADPDYDAGTVADLLGRSPTGELRALVGELGTARSLLCEMHSAMNDTARRAVKRKYGFVPKWQYRAQLERTLASLALQHHERRALEAAVQFHAERGEHVVLLQHDGYRLAPGTVVTPDILRAVSDHVASTTGIRLTYTVKETHMPTPMHDDVVLPKTRNSATTARIVERTAAASPSPSTPTRTFTAGQVASALRPVCWPAWKAAFPLPAIMDQVHQAAADALARAAGNENVEEDDRAEYAVALMVSSLPPQRAAALRKFMDAHRPALVAALAACLDAPTVAPVPVPAPLPRALAPEPEPEEVEDDDSEPVLDARASAVLSLLREARPDFVSADELERAGGSKYQSRIGELRVLGYQIETSAHGDGERSGYRLVSLNRVCPDAVRWGMRVRVGERGDLALSQYGTSEFELSAEAWARVEAAVRAALVAELPSALLARRARA